MSKRPQIDLVNAISAMLDERTRTRSGSNILGEDRDDRRLRGIVGKLLAGVRWDRMQLDELRAILTAIVSAADWRDLPAVDATVRRERKRTFRRARRPAKPGTIIFRAEPHPAVPARPTPITSN